jgi:hypothetical protein
MVNRKAGEIPHRHMIGALNMAVATKLFPNEQSTMIYFYRCTQVLIRTSSLLFAVCMLNYPVLTSTMDGQTTGFGMRDLDIYDPENMLYTDKSCLPPKIEGMSHELKRLISCVDEYHRRNPVDELAQLEAERREEEKANRLPDQKIPRKIWQRCVAKPLPKVLQAYANTWTEQNPEYLHSVCDDKEAAAFVTEFYPTLKPVYDKLRARQTAEEFWAYLVLYKCGGVYAAIDCTCERPIRRLIEGQDDMLVGMQPKVGSRVLQRQLGLHHHTFPFQQWCLAAAPGHPVLRYMIDYVTKNINPCDLLASVSEQIHETSDLPPPVRAARARGRARLTTLAARRPGAGRSAGRARRWTRCCGAGRRPSPTQFSRSARRPSSPATSATPR